MASICNCVFALQKSLCIGNSLWPDLMATHKDSIFVQAFVNSLKPDHNKAILNNKPRILERARIEAATLEDVDHRMVAEKKSGHQ